MEAKMFTKGWSPLPMPSRPWHKQKPQRTRILSVLTRPSENVAGVTDNRNKRLMDSTRRLTQNTNVYRDSWLDLIAINHLSKSLQASAGYQSSKSGYDSLVEAASHVFRKFDANEQREVVVRSLEQAIPKVILTMIRILLPQSKFTREYYAFFTTIFCAWLIGPSEVRASELNGRREKNVVHINKCRFLEQTNCVGMCNNLCKIPSQAFIKDSLGMSLNMIPNFDDMSCEMIFGQDPPSIEDDSALKQPCYKLCKAKQKHSSNCST